MKNYIRNSSLVKNSSVAIFARVITSGVSLLTTPILLQKLGIADYGIWVTMISLIGWLQLTDFGVGYGLKNKITELLANEDKTGASKYFIAMVQFNIVISFIILFLFIFAKGNFLTIYNNISFILMLFLPFIVTIPLNLGATVMSGARKIGLLSILSAITPVLWLLFILTVPRGANNLNLIALGWTTTSLLGNLIIFFVAKSLLEVRMIRFLSMDSLYFGIPILKIGLRFFVLQITSIVLYSLGNYLTFSHLGAHEAARYDTLNKIYLLGMSMFNILISVVWAELSHNLALGNYYNMKRIFKNTFRLSFLFSFLSICLSFVAPSILNLWTRHQLVVTVSEALPFAFLVSVQVIAYSGAVVLNVFEKINGQIILSFIATIIFVPFAALFFNKGLQIDSVPIATTVSTLPTAFFCVYWATKLISKGDEKIAQKNKGTVTQPL